MPGWAAYFFCQALKHHQWLKLLRQLLMTANCFFFPTCHHKSSPVMRITEKKKPRDYLLPVSCQKKKNKEKYWMLDLISNIWIWGLDYSGMTNHASPLRETGSSLVARCHRNVRQHKEMPVLDHRASHFSALTVYKSCHPAEGCRIRLGEQRDRGQRHTIHFCLLGFCQVQTSSWCCVISWWLLGSFELRLALQSVLSLRGATVKEWDQPETRFLGYKKKYTEM